MKWFKSLSLASAIVLIGLLADLMGVFSFATTKLAGDPSATVLAEGVSATTTPFPPDASTSSATPIPEGESLTQNGVSIQITHPIIWSVEPDGTWKLRFYWKVENHSSKEVVLKYDSTNFIVHDNFGQIRSVSGRFGCVSQDRVLKPEEIFDTFLTDTGCRLFITDDGKIDELLVTMQNVLGMEQSKWLITIPNFPPFRP